MRNRSPAIHARQYLTLVARAYADKAGEPAPPAVRTHFLTLHKACVGVKVQAWFLRQTPTRVPELRVGIAFDAHDRATNIRRADAFAARHAIELAALGAEDWPSETGLDRRLMTAVPVAPESTLNQVTAEAAALAGRYAELLAHFEDFFDVVAAEEAGEQDPVADAHGGGHFDGAAERPW